MDYNNSIPILLVTANVGSIFEAPNDMLKIWCDEFLSVIKRVDSKFIGLHCQEVGGKNYEKSMKHVEQFVKILMLSEELSLFDKIQVYLDEDYSSAEHFTALGNLYFVHNSLKDVLIWDFISNEFLPVRDKQIHSNNIESVSTKEKAKFPQNFFPECKWSRKGYLRTRWSLNGTMFDLVNIHLFHDASNFVAMETSPSIYSKNRKRALVHTLQRFHNDDVPYFLFGDFNFRTDTNAVVKKITEGLTTNRVQNIKNNDHTKIQYTNSDDKLILSIGKKEFNHSDLSNCKSSCVGFNPNWLKSYDKEVEQFSDYVTEFPVNFPPSYPFEEDVTKPSIYMPTRCPSWCDRILLSHKAKELICDDQTYPIEYNLMGVDTCMGDHKPVYLTALVKSNTGTVTYCDHSKTMHPECIPPVPCQCSKNSKYSLKSSVKINITDMSDHKTNSNDSFDHYFNNEVDSKFLHQPITKDMLIHEPYTPESVESHSPLPLERQNNEKIVPVSPKLLKSKLEHILESGNNNKMRTRRELISAHSKYSDGGDVEKDIVVVSSNFFDYRDKNSCRSTNSDADNKNRNSLEINEENENCDTRKSALLRLHDLRKRKKCCSIS